MTTTSHRQVATHLYQAAIVLDLAAEAYRAAAADALAGIVASPHKLIGDMYAQRAALLQELAYEEAEAAVRLDPYTVPVDPADETNCESCQ